MPQYLHTHVVNPNVKGNASQIITTCSRVIGAFLQRKAHATHAKKAHAIYERLAHATHERKVHATHERQAHATHEKKALATHELHSH
jgi:hypothetical protein